MLVHAFTKYDREAASTRQRVLQYLPYLAAAGIDVEVRPLLDDAYVRALASGSAPSKTAIVSAYARRLRQLLTLKSGDIVWVYAELFPWMPAPFERLAFRGDKPVVYDFDDAFFQPYDDHANSAVRRALSGKLEPLIKNAALVCAGNDYLKEYADRAGASAIVLPTVVDIDRYVPLPARAAEPLNIGWIGSPSTWTFVRPLLPLLAELCGKHDITVTAVGAGTTAETDRFDGLTFVPWTEASEIAAVQAMDIGIMPLPDEAWARGKSGYKLIQYMACGLPVVASPVGVNSTIVEDGKTGLLATGMEQWHAMLTRLIGDPGLRAAMGRSGRERAVLHYSLQVHAPRLVEAFRAAAGR